MSPKTTTNKKGTKKTTKKRKSNKTKTNSGSLSNTGPFIWYIVAGAVIGIILFIYLSIK